MTSVLSPFVYWAQTPELITLKVELKNVTNFKVNSTPSTLNVNVFGTGAKGENEYEFSLDFHNKINEEVTCKVLDSRIDFTIQKKDKGWWPKLICNPQKPAWLKIDFDKWQSEDDIDEKVRDVTEDYPGLYNRVMEEEYGYRKEDLKKVYLVLYNLSTFVAYVYVMCVIIIRYMRDGPDSMPGTYDAVSNAFKAAQLLTWLEVIHPLVGYTRTSFLPTFLQVGGRTLIIFALINAESRMQTKPVVFYLFLIYATVEIVRYPYYISRIYNKNFGFLTWLRYTIWIPLYPLGFLCEGIIILRSIPYFEETKKFSIFLPNSWNFSFHFPTFLRLILLILILPVMYTLMKHMYRERVKKLGPKSWRKKME